jgi:hypothetical protein
VHLITPCIILFLVLTITVVIYFDSKAFTLCYPRLGIRSVERGYGDFYFDAMFFSSSD